MRRGNVRPGRLTDTHVGACWYRQPIAWLAALIMCASLAAVATTIIVAQRHPDDPVPASDARVLKTPVTRTADPAAPAESEPPE